MSKFRKSPSYINFQTMPQPKTHKEQKKIKNFIDRISDEFPFAVSKNGGLSKVCKQPGCINEVYRGNQCKFHRTCRVNGCKKLATNRGYCYDHRIPGDIDWLDRTEIRYRDQILKASGSHSDNSDEDGQPMESSLTTSSEDSFLDMCECEIGEGNEMEILMLPAEDEKIINKLFKNKTKTRKN